MRLLELTCERFVARFRMVQRFEHLGCDCIAFARIIAHDFVSAVVASGRRH